MKYEVAITQTENGLQSNAEKTLELVNGLEYKKYNYVVTADNYSDAVQDKKDLKKEYEQAKRNRIDFEKKLTREWKPIKETFMKAEKIVESYINNLDAGISSIDAQEADEKKKKIHAFYIENLDELQVPFEKIFEKKWINKSCKQKEWQEGIKKAIANYELEYSLLERSDVEDKELLKSIFMDVWDRNEAFAKYDAQMAAKKRAEKMREEKEAREQANLKKQEEVKEKKELDALRHVNDCLSDTKTYLAEAEFISVAPVTDKGINEMVSIRGSKDAYEKVKSYALSLGLTWEVL